MIFDRVFVPNEHVFMNGEVEFASELCVDPIFQPHSLVTGHDVQGLRRYWKSIAEQSGRALAIERFSPVAMPAGWSDSQPIIGALTSARPDLGMC